MIPCRGTVRRGHRVHRLIHYLKGGINKQGRYFSSLSKLRTSDLVHRTARDSIRNIALNSSLGDLLPIRCYCLASRILRPFFVRHCIRGHLRRFSSFSRRSASGPSPRGGGIDSRNPCVVYMSASNSVHRNHRHLTGSTILTVTHLARTASQGYCIVGFSRSVRALLVHSLGASFPVLISFLRHHFSKKASTHPTFSRTLVVLHARN